MGDRHEAKWQDSMNTLEKIVIQTEDAPKAIGTYSQAILKDGVLYVSGQIGLDPETSQLVAEDTQAQLEQAFQNMQSILHAAGADFAHVVKLNVFLIDLSDFALVNSIMTRYFKEPYPARAVIGVMALPKGAKVEIDAIAAL